MSNKNLTTDNKPISLDKIMNESKKTTEIYTHVSKKSLANIKSPLDRFFDNKKLNNNKLNEQ